MRMIGKTTTAILAMVPAVAIAPAPTLTPSEYEGTRKVKDISGMPFKITLSNDGRASPNRSGEGAEGTWKEDGGEPP